MDNVSISSSMEKEYSDDLLVARRRLSVVSDNKLIEGVGCIELDGDETKCKENGTKNLSTVNGSEVDSAEKEIPKNVVSCYAGYSKRGYAPYNPRKKNQDALVMAEDAETGSLLFVVFDGHGEAGDKVAQALKQQLAPAVFSHPLWNIDVIRAMEEAIESVENIVLCDAYIDTDFSGSTLVAACIRGNTITVANVGDSRAILGIKSENGSFFAEPLSTDHKPDVPTEKERILSFGGRVFAVEYEDGLDGPPRVWLGHMDVPGLAMSRSLGDKVAHSAGVSSSPEFIVRELDPNAGHCMILLATDGIWEFMSNEECVQMIAEASQPRLAVESLIMEASERWLKEEQVVDDATVCVAFLGGWTGGGA